MWQCCTVQGRDLLAVCSGEWSPDIGGARVQGELGQEVKGEWNSGGQLSHFSSIIDLQRRIKCNRSLLSFDPTKKALNLTTVNGIVNICKEILNI